MRLFAAVQPQVRLLGQLKAEPRDRTFLHLGLRSRPGLRGCVLNSTFLDHEAETHELPVDGFRKHKDDLDEMPHMIESIRGALRSMSGGEISVSPYDTAMVSLVKNLDGGDGPQFPSTIEWIVQNQLPDGSWGDGAFFMVRDRIINTLACVVALTSWNIYTDNCKRGLLFIRQNMSRLAGEDDDWMLVGFEIAFPSLLDMAKDLDLDIPYDDPALQAIYAKRNLKLAKIPTDILHETPTTLLHSIEGMVNLDWQKLLKLRCLDGSFHSSPSATAFALEHTGDKKCLEFLDGIIENFAGAVPCIYPLDVYEHLWAVDRLMRLGISRHFVSEIEGCLEFAHRHWTQEGLAHTKNCPVKDIDDTAMGFRLLRLHGYHVKPCVFKNFEKDGKFFCLRGESNPSSVTPMYNTYRASQFAFPSDDAVIGRAEVYCRRFLEERRASNKLKDKWAIAKDIRGEVEYALDYPWKASLPRVETRMYLEQYGGSADVWIGKVLHRMTLFCNDLYLKMAKVDFNRFQVLCRLELHGMKEWYSRNNLQKYGGPPTKSLLTAYFLASANIFEPERVAERLGWSRTLVLVDVASSYFRRIGGAKNSRENLDRLIDLVAFGNSNSDSLRKAWKQWLMACDGKDSQVSWDGDTALLLVRAIEIISGRHARIAENDNLSEYSRLEQLTSSICDKLSARVLVQNGNIQDLDNQVDSEMQEITQRVLEGSNGINKLSRQTFLHVVKSFCYVTHCSPETIDSHISKVIFQDVI
ncbi:syn-copalyl diphosphate synthase, chloroplastic-like [Hordeum vulgare subsp. vulgare]|nr:syn-copalyl diphosphate synthase, chloroplastic-like [Hordeum vulgare subsp. vulgare]